MKDINFTFADSAEEGTIRRLLSESGLPHKDIANHLHHFMLAKSGSNLIGVVGLEVLGELGLLRSLAIESSHRGKGIGRMLYERILAYAHLKGLKELYLLTDTAEGFFRRLCLLTLRWSQTAGLRCTAMTVNKLQ
ncbi:MAG: GNAT family N-acetyltransferase [Thermodesulfobacteriota bacterium]